MVYHDQFGFLPQEANISFSCGEVEPRADYKNEEESWMKQAHPDGYVYQIESKFTLRDEQQGWQKVPNSERPAPIQRVPWSHHLSLDTTTTEQDQLRRGIAGFLIQFLGFLYGYRVQFHDWWLDGRIKIKSRAPYILHASCPISACIDKALNTWRGLDGISQNIITNALYLFSRTEIFEFQWERFINEYMIFDALYKVAVNAKLIKSNINHGERLRKMAKTFDIVAPPPIGGK